MAKNRNKKAKNKKKIIHKNWHHTFPTSRFILKKDIEKHNAWHKLFWNKDTQSVKFQLEKWANKEGKIDSTITNKPEWKLIFGDITDLVAAKKIIDLEWRYPGIVGIVIPEELKQEKNIFSINVKYESFERILIELTKEVCDV